MRPRTEWECHVPLHPDRTGGGWRWTRPACALTEEKWELQDALECQRLMGQANGPADGGAGGVILARTRPFTGWNSTYTGIHRHENPVRDIVDGPQYKIT